MSMQKSISDTSEDDPIDSSMRQFPGLDSVGSFFLKALKVFFSEVHQQLAFFYHKKVSSYSKEDTITVGKTTYLGTLKNPLPLNLYLLLRFTNLNCLKISGPSYVTTSFALKQFLTTTPRPNVFSLHLCKPAATFPLLITASNIRNTFLF